MRLAIITKTKPTTKLINTSFNKLSLKEIDSVVSVEKDSSEYPWTKKQLSESIANSNNLNYILVLESKIIGYIITMPSIDSADILNIVIHKDFKRKGFGSSLIVEISKVLSQKKIKTIFIEVRKSNLSAISFYLSLGFKEISIRKNYYSKNSNKLSRKEDGIIMCLEISRLIKK
ncbi:MAG: ribosomal protein S18-alanine N-acetyltransferase [Pseudomonadota bacterium]|nr:ribosomal protein S18-alanine N-acetyltransferase [Pseudomonadota bacterium]